MSDERVERVAAWLYARIIDERKVWAPDTFAKPLPSWEELEDYMRTAWLTEARRLIQECNL